MNAKFQSKVISEIVETEKTYINALEKLQNFFSKPALERGLLPSHVHSAIFSQLSAIYQMNSQLLEEILNDKENIGCAFLKFGPFLKVYSSYANNFQRSLEILQKWENDNEPFKAFINATETRPEVQAKLSSLLITPIQRIPRYKLLLEELLKCSDSNSQTFQDIEGALIKVAEAAKHIDRSVFEAQAFSRLLIVQRALKDQQPSIIAPGRKLLKEGILNKVSRKGNGSQSRFFFLFTDMLIYTKLPFQNIAQNSKETCSSSSDFDLKPNSLECCCMLPLRYCRVKMVFGSSDQGITFRLQCSDEDLLLYCSIASEGEAWIIAIKKASEEALQKRKTLRRPSSRRKAIRRTTLRSISFSEEEPKEELNSKNECKYPKFLELESLKNRLRHAKDCLTPPKPVMIPQGEKKIQPNRTETKSIANQSLEIQAPSNLVQIKTINHQTPITSRPITIRTTVRKSPVRMQAPSSNQPIKMHTPLNGSFRTPKPLSPLATCSWDDAYSPRSDSKPFMFQSGVRGREGSQLTPTSSLKEKKGKKKKKGQKMRLFSPRKKQKMSKD